MTQARTRSTALGYALLAPSLFGVVVFLLLPMLVVVWLSLHRWDLLGPVSYVGDGDSLCVEVGRQAAPEHLRPSFVDVETALRDMKKAA